jgi:glycosyltransferase involved in cell wall biosynthesis
MTSRLRLEFSEESGVRELSFKTESVRSPRFLPVLIASLWRDRRARVVFISNPTVVDFVLARGIKQAHGRRVTVVFFDVILRRPNTALGKVLARLKRWLLQSVDLFICIHKDLSGYADLYGISEKRCVYIPFKPNNADLAPSVMCTDGDYLVSLGASQRDHALLLHAIAGTDIPLKLILPTTSITRHNSNFHDVTIPSNVEHVSVPLSRSEWSDCIARSRGVVIPIIPGTIQPAGISVCLESMVFGKPVIITRGASTNGLIDASMAVIVEAGNVEEMRAAISRLWSDSDFRSVIGRAARAYALNLGDHQRLISDIRNVISPLIH